MLKENLSVYMRDGQRFHFKYEQEYCFTNPPKSWKKYSTADVLPVLLMQQLVEHVDVQLYTSQLVTGDYFKILVVLEFVGHF